MIKIGEYQTLTVRNERSEGLYLEDDQGDDILMPKRYVTEGTKQGDKIEVFVYIDSNEMDIATNEKPLLTVGQFAYLHVNDVNNIGAFCDWGVSKELFIPFRNQESKLRSGQRTVVYMFLDEKSDRLVGSTRLYNFLLAEADEGIQKGQEVDLLVWEETDLGYKVIINQRYVGLVYLNEVYQQIKPGQKLKGFIKPIRTDGKIDVSLYPLGHESIEPNARIILEKLRTNNGFLPYTDKSDPQLIRDEFGVSKKLFKKSLGSLYKERLVRLEKDGIYLTNRNQGK